MKFEFEGLAGRHGYDVTGIPHEEIHIVIDEEFTPTYFRYARTEPAPDAEQDEDRPAQ